MCRCRALYCRRQRRNQPSARRRVPFSAVGEPEDETSLAGLTARATQPPRLSVELDELLIGAIVDSAAAESTDRPYGAVVRIVALVPRADPLRVSEYHYR